MKIPGHFSVEINTGTTSLPWPVFQPGPDWALDLIILSDGGQTLDAVQPPGSPLSQIWRAIEVSGLATGLLRPIENSPEQPIIPLSIAAQLALTPDAKLVALPGQNPLTARRAFFSPQSLPDGDLDRIVEMVPAKTVAREALAGFRRTRTGPFNIGDVDERCASGNLETRAAVECHWRQLVDTVLDDIDTVTAVFRASPTLEDRYTVEQADALVRLGRYFVLLKGKEIDEALKSASARKGEQH